MDTLSLTDSNLKFNIVKSNQLYYDQFEYRIVFYLQELACLRNLKNDPEKDRIMISWNLDQRKKFKEHVRQVNWGGNWHNRASGLPIGPEVETNLLSFYDFYMSDLDAKKLVIQSGGYGYLYTNNKKYIEELSRLTFIKKVHGYQISVVFPKGTIILKNPKHPYRLYLKYKKITKQQKSHLVNFLKNHEGQIRLGPAFKEWVKKDDYCYLFGNFFIEYNHESFVSLLSLVSPTAVRKTVTLVKA